MSTAPVTLDAGEFEEEKSSSAPVSLSQGEFEFEDEKPSAAADTDFSHPAGAVGPLPGVPAHPAVSMYEPKLFGVDVPAGAKEDVRKGLTQSYNDNPGPLVTAAGVATKAVGNVASGLKDIYTPTDAEIRAHDFPTAPMTPEEKQAATRQASRGLAQVIAGGSTGIIAASAPELMELGIAADAGDVAAKAAIIKMLGAAEVGKAASDVSGKAADKLNLSPETKELVQTAAFFLPSLAGVAGARGGVGVDAQGNPGIAGQAGPVTAGIRGTPEAFQGGIRVGGTGFEVNIPRGGRPAPSGPQLPPSPADITQAQQAQAATSAIAQADAISKAADAVVGGAPPPVPPQQGPPPPPSMQGNQLSQKTVDSMTQLIAAAPEEARAKLQMEAHGKLAEWIGKTGRFVGPDGKLYTADTPQKADSIAEKIINDAIATHTKAQETQQKEQEAQLKESEKAAAQQQKDEEKRQKEAEKAAKEKNDNGLTQEEQTAARVKTLIDSNPGHKDPTSMIQRVLRVDPARAQELIRQYQQDQVTVGSKGEPVVEESQKTVDAQLDSLKRGTIKAVMLPTGSKYQPPTPPGMKSIEVSGDAAGAGRYIYDPQQVRAATIKEAAKAGTHGDLLGHLQPKEELDKSEAPQVVVQAKTPEGTVIQDSVVEDSPEMVQQQAELLQERHPEAKIDVSQPEDVLAQREAEQPAQLEEGEFEEATDAVGERRTEEMGQQSSGAQGSGGQGSAGVEPGQQGTEVARAEGATEEGQADNTGLREQAVESEYDRDIREYHEVRDKLRSEAEKRFSKPYDVDLYDALNSFNRAGNRWVKRRETGMTDADLAKAVNEEMGIGSSSGRNGGLGYETRPGKFWHERMPSGGKPTLQGSALVAEVRRLMDIPQPKKEVEQNPPPKGEITGKSPEQAAGTASAKPVPAPKTLSKGDKVTFKDRSGNERSGTIVHTAERITRIKSEGKEYTVPTKTVQSPSTTKYDFGSTQFNLPKDSDAHAAIEQARAQVADSDLMGKGKDIGDNHVTVRYGIQGADVSKIRDFLKNQKPFEAKLGAIDSFPPSTYSQGAAILKAQVESPELHKLNAEIESKGDFKKSDFDSYKPHVTIAYVDPEAIDKYVGSDIANGKTFKVDRVEISDRNGNLETVHFGASNDVAKQEAPAENTEHEALSEPPSPILNSERAGGEPVQSGEGGPGHAEEVANVDRNGSTGAGREVADSGSPDTQPVAEVSRGVRPEPQGKREAGEPGETDGSRLSRSDERVPAEGPGSGSGEGSDSALDNSPGQRVVKEANKNLAKIPKQNAKWYTHPDNWTAPPGVMGKMDANLRALQILRDIEKNPRPATEDEKHELSQFVGWGALQWIFEPHRAPYDQRERFIRANRTLSDLLNPEEMAAGRKSTLNAHYTSPELVRAMWDITKRLGFKGGNVLEPSMGSGNFFGMMPKAIRNNVSAMGNELDPVTAGIAKLLYPGANIFNKDFVELIIPDNSIDLAISNVPFGGKIYDPKYPKLNAEIHDYFFVKSLDKIRPGGVMAFITSTGTMDKPNGVREALASKADLLGAIRFPSGAFAKNAGTTVTTDLLILQKRAPGQAARHAGDWMKSVKTTVPDDVDRSDRGTHETNLNEYFVEHPEMMLGRPGVSQMYSRSGFALYPHAEGKIEELLDKAIAKLPRGVMLDEKPVGSGQAETVAQFANQSQMEGQYTLDDKGNLKQVVGGKLVKPEATIQKDGSVSVAKVQRIKSMVGLRDTLNDLLSSMTTESDDDAGNAAVAKRREKLAKEYKSFVEKNGYLSAPANNVFEDDPHYPRLLALENYDKATKMGTPADILQKRTVYPRTPLTAVSDNPKDALYQILAERGYPDVEMMARLQGKEPKEVAQKLLDEGLIFRDPHTGDYQMKEKYLSGYVRDKLDYARKAVEQGYKEFAPNVTALEKVQPKDVTIKDIEVKLGATWIPLPAIQDFANETFAQKWAPKITYTAGTWSVSNMQPTAEVITVYGTPRVSADTLLELALNQKEITINDKDADGNAVMNVPETLLARQQQQKIRDQFNSWAEQAPKWAKPLEKAYNYAFNNIVLPEYDGSHLTFPGKNASITLAPHQVNAVWRLLSEGRGLLAHAVGAGKTFEGVSFVMEARRTGQFRKPVINVPNHLVEQWRKEWLQLYPGANILVPTDKDFDSKNRQRLMAKIATSDFDAVIMARSQFDRFDMSPEMQEKVINQQQDELLETIASMKASRDSDKRTVKQLEKSLEALKTRIQKLQDAPRDKVINFDDTGIDMVLTDEAHDYKNLAFYTKMTRIAGLSQGDAKRAIAMKAKMDYLLERNNYKGVIFATGTPVQNTMAEQYNMTKYVAPDVLEKAGIKFFDDWAANFGSVRTVTEVAADGRSYKQRQKFSRFSNVPELMRMFRSFTDIKTAADLNLPVPKLEGGKPSTNMVAASEDLDEYVKDLMKRAETVKSKNPKEDNMLKITGDGRKAATDMRLVSAAYPDDPDSKINQVVEDVYQEWKDGKADRLTQMVFLDNYQAYTAKRDALGDVQGTEVRLDLYKDMKKKWMALGVPENEIAIIGDYDTKEKKSKLFAAMNSGDVRILMGSTAKMGAGTNAQRKLKALHHVDLPWRPGDLEQRNGRIIRQGNTNKEVKVKNWLTKGSFDTYMLQALESKATFIEQLMNGRFEGRSMEDVNSEMSMNLQEMKIATSGNPDVKRKFDLEAEKNGLYQLKRAADRQRADSTFMVGNLNKRAADMDAFAKRVEVAEKKYDKAKGADGKGFTMRYEGKDYTDQTEAGKFMESTEVPNANFYMDVNGVGYSVQTFDSDKNEPTMKVVAEYGKDWKVDNRSMDGLLRSITRRQLDLPGSAKDAIEDAATARAKAAKIKASSEESFPQQARLDAIDEELKVVNQKLGIGGPKKDVVEDQVATEQDEDDEPEAEDEEGETKPAKRETKGTELRASVFGLDILAKYMAEAGVKFFQKDIAPHLSAAGPTKAGKQIAGVLYPRIGANVDALDSLFEAKGDREKHRVMLEQIQGGLEKFFDKMPLDANIAFMDRSKMGISQLGSTPEETKKLNDVRELMESIGYESTQRMLNYKPNMKLREHYYGMLWKKIPDATGKHAVANAARANMKGTGQGKRPFEGAKSFLKRSTLDNITEGINMGGEPVTKNAWKMFSLVEAQKMQYITAQDHWLRLKNYGLRKFVGHNEKAPDGWKPLDDRLSKIFFPANSGEGMVHAGDWYLEESAARMLNNYLSRDLIRESAIGNALMVAKNIATSIELSMSPFHFIFETLEAMGSQMAQGGQRFINLGLKQHNPAEMAKGLKEASTFPAAPILMARRGGNVLRSIQKPQDFADTKRGGSFISAFPNAPHMIDLLYKGGLTWGQSPDYRTSPMSSFKEAAKEGNYIGAVLRAVPAFNDLVMKPLFEVYIPRLKWGFAMEQLAIQLAQNADKLAAGDITEGQIARQVVDTVENRFGEMNFSNVGWNNTFKSLMQLQFRSVTWKLGNWRGAGQAVTSEMKDALADPLEAFKRSRRGENTKAGDYIPTMGPNMAWLLGVGAITIMIGTIAEKYFTGKFPWEWAAEDKNAGYSAAGSMLLESIHPRTGKMNPYTKKPERLSLPTGMRDFEHAFHDPRSYVKSSLAGTSSRAIDIWQNRDFFNDYVYDPNGHMLQKAKEIFQYAAPQPIGVQSLTSKYGSQETSSKVMRSLGFSASSGAGLDLSPAENALRVIHQANHDPMTPKEKAAKEEGFNSSTIHRPSASSIRKAIKNGDVNYAAGMFSELSYTQAREIFDLANDHEKKILRPMLEAKRKNQLKKTGKAGL